MKLNRTGSVWNRSERIKINDNWDIIEDFKNKGSEELFNTEAFSEWLNENQLKMKPAVDTVTQLPKNASKNDVIGVKANNTIYVNDGSKWVVLTVFSFDEFNAIKADLNTWQRHKLTRDDGQVERLSGFDFDTEIDNLSGSKFFYVTSSRNGPQSVSSSGFVEVLKRVDDSTGAPQFKVLYTPYNSEKVFMRLKYLEWRTWVEITNLSEDTGWIPFALNAGIRDKVAFQASGENGFPSSYRTIKMGEEVKRFLRINVDNITNNQVLGYLPQGFVLNSQTLYIRTKWSEVGIITVRPSGEVKFHRAESSRDWLPSDYIYGELSWSDYVKKPQ